MNISSNLLALGQVWFFNLLLIPLLFLIIKRLDWKTLINDKVLQHRFFAATLVLFIIWQVNISISLDVAIHFLGITTLCLMFGWSLALLGALVAQAGFLILGQGQWESFALNYFINAVIPIAFTWQLHLWIESKKPQNPFVFIMGAGFLSCLLSSILVATLAGVMLFLGGQFKFNLGVLDYISYLPLFIFPEAVVNGMFISGFSILHPHWMQAFNDERYFQKPTPGQEVEQGKVPDALNLDAQEMQTDREGKSDSEPLEAEDFDKYRPPEGWRNKALDNKDNDNSLNEKDNKKHD
ncbi:energy-coupling factor ABC transporter permease [Marinomonas sp. PE14-40]|uniref:energy-coupling factor ABC transporter permease n=1 Tax=Marinomonas sp. PE14-40 TaxID=3060621 RepID=UPI003F670B4F